MVCKKVLKYFLWMTKKRHYIKLSLSSSAESGRIRNGGIEGNRNGVELYVRDGMIRVDVRIERRVCIASGTCRERRLKRIEKRNYLPLSRTKSRVTVCYYNCHLRTCLRLPNILTEFLYLYSKRLDGAYREPGIRYRGSRLSDILILAYG